MKVPLVSVIVPNYNHAPYLKQRLDSIFNQTFQDFEVIILDDCSTDNSKEIIEQYRSNPKVSHIIYNETNSGSPFKQWAKGFDLAQGEYIWIAESDDWAENVFLEKNTSTLDQDKSLSLVFCGSIIEDGTSEKSNDILSESVKINSYEALSHFMSMCSLIRNASSVLFKADLAKQVTKDFTSFKSSGDYFFWVCLLENGDLYYNNLRLNHYRIHNHNTSIKKRLSGQSFIEDLRIHSYLKSKGYQTFFQTQMITLAYLSKIYEELEANPHGKMLLEARKLWRQEIFSANLSKLIVKIGPIVWKLWQKIHNQPFFKKQEND